MALRRKGKVRVISDKQKNAPSMDGPALAVLYPCLFLELAGLIHYVRGVASKQTAATHQKMANSV